MYTSTSFRETRLDRLWSLIERHPFGVLVTASGGFAATHVPVLVDRHRGPLGTLRGHVARANPQAAAIRSGADGLLILASPSAYVSPSWYTAEPDVPTWNYAAVHARGRLVPLTGGRELAQLLADSVDRFERDRAEPWRLDVLDPTLVRGLERGVVGFELPVERLDGGFKLSQDKQPADVAAVMAGLATEGDPGAAAVLELMRAHYG